MLLLPQSGFIGTKINLLAKNNHRACKSLGQFNHKLNQKNLLETKDCTEQQGGNTALVWNYM